ncbi:MAG TPA: hypothetical protein EYG79_12685 [Rhodobacteraceae bacterium]|nr:hypothetical protein [Paracoccaceae bacterium]
MTPNNSAKMIQIVAWGFIAFAIIWGLAPYGSVSAPSRILLDIIDGLGSYASGVGSNAVFNIVLFVAIMVPLVTLRFEDS